MNTTSDIDFAGMIEVRRLLENISKEGEWGYNWNVSVFPEDRDRRENVHWDIIVNLKKDEYSFRVQLKTTIKTAPKIEVGHLIDWLNLNPDTIIVVYYLSTKTAYWTAPQLLFTKKNIENNNWYTFKESDFKILNEENKGELLNYLTFLKGIKKKDVFNIGLYPTRYSDFVISKTNIQGVSLI